MAPLAEEPVALVNDFQNDAEEHSETAMIVNGVKDVLRDEETPTEAESDAPLTEEETREIEPETSSPFDFSALCCGLNLVSFGEDEESRKAREEEEARQVQEKASTTIQARARGAIAREQVAEIKAEKKAEEERRIAAAKRIAEAAAEAAVVRSNKKRAKKSTSRSVAPKAAPKKKKGLLATLFGGCKNSSDQVEL